MESLSQYHIFYTVAKTGNISAAANELFISQPAVSKSIKKLEDLLQTTLLIRGPRGVKCTEDGEILYKHLASAFSSIQAGEQLLQRNRAFEIGQIHIGSSTTLCKHIMLPLLQTFVKKNPHVRVTIDGLSSRETALHLAANKMDVGLLVETSASKSLPFTPLTELSYTFVASKQYLENLKLREGIDYTKKDPSFFQKATLMLMDHENISRQHIEAYFSANSIQTRQILETSNMELLIEFAKIGLGVSCLIRNFVENDIENGTLIEIPLRKNISMRTVGFAYSKDSVYNPAVTKFKQMISETYGK
ncbi:MAG: LysR family transcriptional regulator [Eubacterium sp.]